MSDELFERRLRTALRAEAAALPFTITEAELRRRASARHRARSNRSLGLLIAAAVGVGLLGVGAAAGAWLERRDHAIQPAPSSPIAQASAETPAPSNLVLPLALPPLDDLIADGGEDHLVLAQSNGPSDGPSLQPNRVDLGAPDVTFGPDLGPGNYRVTFGCMGPAMAGVELRALSSLGGILTPHLACTGLITTFDAHLSDQGAARLVLDHRASWRLAVHRIDGPVAIASGSPAMPESAPDDGEFLTRTDLQPTDAQPSGPVDIGIPTRERYSLDVSCTQAQTARYGFGEDVDGVATLTTTVVVPCDGAIHTARIGIGELLGSQLYVEIGQAHISVMVRSDAPPIAIAADRPGWQMSSALGPSYVSESGEQGTSLVAHEAAGPVLLVIACGGTGPMTGTVDTGVVEGAHVSPFSLDCRPDGAEVEHVYQVDGPNVTVYYTAPIRSFVAVSALEPKP